jgi:RNA-directed DNA polymerase
LVSSGFSAVRLKPLGTLEKEGSKMKLHERQLAESAPSARSEDWHSIVWASVHEQVRGLQIRIAKATQIGDWRRVKALQRFLVQSFSGRCLAVRRVTENAGRRTPGVDGETWSTPESKWQAIQLLSSRGYQPQPLRRVYIPKSNGKMRPLGIPTLRDRAMQALYLLALEPVAETLADPNSYGFRKCRSTHDAIAQLFILLGQKSGAQWVLEGDIKGCFDNISHEWLERNVCMDTAILHKWLKAGYIESRKLFPTNAGTPQGGIISPTLSNRALDQFEVELGKRLAPNQHQIERKRLHLVRYADDFVITGYSKEFLENEVKPVVENFLAERGLQLSQEKTKITHIAEGFDFLGQNVRKYNGKLLIKPAAKNVKAFLDKVRGHIKVNSSVNQEILIRLLNPVIRGWANYHRGIVAKETFARVDSIIWKSLWRWSRRRHPKKSRQWIAERYFRTVGGRNWVFACDTRNRKGEDVPLLLFRAADVRIVRHIKVRADANPFDPLQDDYFAKLKRSAMVRRLEDRKFLLNLWKRQDGVCPGCGQLITDSDKWHVHHVVRRIDGGSGKLDNLEMLHPNCHRQVHAFP